MLEGIIGAAITAVASIICQLIISKNNQNLIEYKIDELTERVDKHNNLIERTYKLEESAKLMDEKMKVANHRIDDLERVKK